MGAFSDRGQQEWSKGSHYRRSSRLASPKKHKLLHLSLSICKSQTMQASEVYDSSLGRRRRRRDRTKTKSKINSWHESDAGYFRPRAHLGRSLLLLFRGRVCMKLKGNEDTHAVSIGRAKGANVAGQTADRRKSQWRDVHTPRRERKRNTLTYAPRNKRKHEKRQRVQNTTRKYGLEPRICAMCVENFAYIGDCAALDGTLTFLNSPLGACERGYEILV